MYKGSRVQLAILLPMGFSSVFGIFVIAWFRGIFLSGRQSVGLSGLLLLRQTVSPSIVQRCADFVFFP
ncbi:MAG: hypothetical protein AB7P17_11240 [Nitrospirales bacterium]|nr:hypothetical protein [Nitrospirales bacterium]